MRYRKKSNYFQFLVASFKKHIKFFFHFVRTWGEADKVILLDLDNNNQTNFKNAIFTKTSVVKQVSNAEI